MTATLLSLWRGHLPRTAAFIVQDVAERHGLTVEDLTGPARYRHIAWPRQEAMWLMRQHTPMSTTNIGRRLGGRDHKTVVEGINRYKARMAGTLTQ